MLKLADASPIPKLQELYTNPSSNPVLTKFPTFKLGEILSGLLDIAFFIAIFMAFYYLIWGTFAYIMARGNKEDLAKARARITWALIGLLVVITAYLIATYIGEIFTPTKGGLPFPINK